MTYNNKIQKQTTFLMVVYKIQKIQFPQVLQKKQANQIVQLQQNYSLSRNSRAFSKNSFNQKFNSNSLIVQMFFFSHKIKFKKQSQSLGLNLNDKYIKRSKNQLIDLTKKHRQVDQSLKKKKSEFEKDKNQLILEHQRLIDEQKRHKLKILKLQVRKDQLQSKQNPKIKQVKAQILKKYLQCMTYSIGNKYQLIKSMNGFQRYDFVKTKILNLEWRLYIKNRMKQVVFMKKLHFQEEQIMLIIKEKLIPTQRKVVYGESDNASMKSKTAKSLFMPSKFNPVSDENLNFKKYYQIHIFAISGKDFEIFKTYSQTQLSKYIQKLSYSNNKKSSNAMDTFTTTGRLQNPQINNKRKPRLSLQFNSVFKKSFQGFFNKRTSHTSNELQNKLVNIQELIKQSKRQSKSQINSDRSGKRSSRLKSIKGSEQENSQSKNTRRSRISRITSEQKQNKSDDQSNQNSTNRKNGSLKQKQEKKYKFQKPHLQQQSQLKQNGYYPAFRQQSQQQSIDTANKINQSRHTINQNNTIHNDSGQLSNENTSRNKTFTITTCQGIVRSFLYGQKTLFPSHNPILNIIILKQKKQMYFIPQYLDIKQNYNFINLCVRKYQLKLKLQRQVNKVLLYKIVQYDNFFETQNQVMQKFNVKLLFTIKYGKDDIYIPKTQDIKQSLKQGKQIKSNHANAKGRKSKVFFENIRGGQIRGFNNQDIIISCENIKCQTQQRTFLIHKLLREEAQFDVNNRVFNLMSNVNTINNRMKGRNPQIQLKKRQAELEKLENRSTKEKKKRKKLTKGQFSNDKDNDEQKTLQKIKQQQERKQKFKQEINLLYENFIKDHFLSIRQYKFMKRIQFNKHLGKIIVIQKYLKCFYYKKKYKEYRKNKKTVMLYKYEPNTKILITMISNPQQNNVKVFTQCLLLRLNDKYKSHPLTYEHKFWATISSALSNLIKLSDSIIQVKDQLEKYLTKKIKIFEIQQSRLQALKPQLYLNRLRRFFINIMLSVKAKKNIVFLKKIYQNSQWYVLIIRRSPILKTVCQANLYHLEQFIEKEQNKQNLKQEADDSLFQQEQETEKTTKTLKKSTFQANRNKPHYQTISLLTSYFNQIPKQKIFQQFYFDSMHFLLKPPKNSSIHYIERLLAIDINSEEIGKQITLIQWQQPTKKRKNGENQSFLNGDGDFFGNDMNLLNLNKNNSKESSKSKSSANSHNSKLKKLNDINQYRNIRLKRKNASILIVDEINQHPSQQNRSKLSVMDKERKSFRISMKNTLVLKNVVEQKDNKKMNLKVVSPPSINISNPHANNIRYQQQQSHSKISSGHRLSRSSLYDIFNNKKMQYEIKGNGHGKMLYYSLMKTQQVFYQLNIYIIDRKYIIKNSSGENTQLCNKNYNSNEQENSFTEVRNNINQQLLLNSNRKYHQQYIQQSIINNQSQEYYLRNKKFNDQLVLVYKENIIKKQLLQANWTLIYGKIARWIKDNQHLLILVETTAGCGK